VLAVTARPATIAAARQAMENFGREFVDLGLPSSPRQFIVVHDDLDLPAGESQCA
jgi:peptidyl-tRNA hydrolase